MPFDDGDDGWRRPRRSGRGGHLQAHAGDQQPGDAEPGGEAEGEEGDAGRRMLPSSKPEQRRDEQVQRQGVPPTARCEAGTMGWLASVRTDSGMPARNEEKGSTAIYLMQGCRN